MDRCILDAMESLTAELALNAETLGVDAGNIIRIYSPSYFLESLAGGESYLAVYLQDCTCDTEEVQAGVMKTISARLAVVRKIGTTSNAELDPMVDCFENLQNFLTGFRSWASEARRYEIQKVTNVSILDDEALDSLIAMGAVDLELQAFIPY